MKAQFHRKIGGDSLTLSNCSEVEIIEDTDTGGRIYVLKCFTRRPDEVSHIDFASVTLNVTSSSQTVLEGDFRVLSTEFPQQMSRLTTITTGRSVRIELTPLGGYPQTCSDLEESGAYND